MNSAQRLLRVAVVVLVGIMVAFPPYIIRSKESRWVTYGVLWQPPYPEQNNTLPSLPYSEGHPSALILLFQIAALWMVSSVVYTKLGKIAFDTDKYPEYYRP